MNNNAYICSEYQECYAIIFILYIESNLKNQDYESKIIASVTPVRDKK